MIRDVVFDLGKVLLDWDPRHLFCTVVADAATADALEATLRIDDAQHQLDLGVPVQTVHDRWRAMFPEHDEIVDRYFTDWQRTIAGAQQDVVEVLADVHATGRGLYVLSNFSGTLFRQARPRFGFLEWFDGLVISGDEGVVKPDPRIYRRLLDRYSLTPSTTVFIDDRDDNVAGAVAQGIVGIPFRDAPSLRADLRALDVI